MQKKESSSWFVHVCSVGPHGYQPGWYHQPPMAQATDLRVTTDSCVLWPYTGPFLNTSPLCRHRSMHLSAQHSLSLATSWTLAGAKSLSHITIPFLTSIMIFPIYNVTPKFPCSSFRCFHLIFLKPCEIVPLTPQMSPKYWTFSNSMLHYPHVLILTHLQMV